MAISNNQEIRNKQMLDMKLQSLHLGQELSWRLSLEYGVSFV